MKKSKIPKLCQNLGLDELVHECGRQLLLLHPNQSHCKLFVYF